MKESDFEDEVSEWGKGSQNFEDAGGCWDLGVLAACKLQFLFCGNWEGSLFRRLERQGWWLITLTRWCHYPEEDFNNISPVSLNSSGIPHLLL